MGICVITDTDNRVRTFCHADAVLDGVPLVCGVGSGCLAATEAGHVRRHYDGTKTAFEAALVTAGAADWSEMDGVTYDGTTFGWLGILPRP